MVSIPRVLVPAVAGFALIAALCGCTTGHTFPVHIQPIITATPRPPTDPLAITCDDLLSSVNQDAYTRVGFVEIDDFATRQVAEGAPNAAFVEYGGALCQWGMPNTDTSDVFGASRIDDDHEQSQRSRLEAEGYEVESHNGGDLYSLADANGTENHYLFANGFWFFANAEAAVDHIRQNADVG